MVKNTFCDTRPKRLASKLMTPPLWRPISTQKIDGEQSIVFETHVGDFSPAGPGQPYSIVRDPVTDEPTPYVHIRRGMEALIDRKSFYRLVEIGEHEHHDGAQWFGINSGGTFFPIIPSSELE